MLKTNTFICEHEMKSHEQDRELENPVSYLDRDQGLERAGAGGQNEAVGVLSYTYIPCKIAR
jgi:hypothetical protein